MNKYSIIVSLILYWVCFFILLPHFFHQVDPDGIAYINEAKLFFSGGFITGLNGCWSPLFPLMLSPFVKLGVDPLLLCRLFNGLFSCLLLLSVNGLVKKFKVNYPFCLILLPFVICTITLSMTFHLLGPDILQTLLLTVLLNILLHKGFFEKKTRIVLAAFIGALCYFAKAYNFSIIILFFGVVFFLHYFKSVKSVFSFFIVKKIAFFYLFFLLFCSPYIIAISIKYKRVTISTASAITMHKSLEPLDYYSSKDLFIPPPSVYSLASSDDPSLTSPTHINLFTSKHYFFKSIKIFFATIIEYTKVLNAISFTSVAIILFFIFYFFKEYEKNELKKNLLAFTLLYPIGYFLIAIEWRYVWINTFTLLVMLVILLGDFYKRNVFTKPVLYLLTFFSLLSFCIAPITSIRKNNLGETAYQISADLKKNGIQGNFIYDPNHKFDYYFLSYFSNSKCFGIYNTHFTNGDIIQNKVKYGIRYIFCYYKDEKEKNKILLSDFKNISNKVFDKEIRNLIVFELQ